VGDEVKRCEVCGESGCWALADWSMGGAPGEYEEAMAKHYRLGYVHEKARAEKAEAERDEAQGANILNRNALRVTKESLANAVENEKQWCASATAAEAALARALIPPAAAPEVEDDEPRCNTFGAMGLPSIAPAAETGKAQEAEAPPAFRVTAGDVERLERVYQIGCETMARQGQIAETFRTAHVANEALRLLAARAAPPEREGK
jgi:hypothetical protein